MSKQFSSMMSSQNGIKPVQPPCERHIPLIKCQGGQSSVACKNHDFIAKHPNWLGIFASLMICISGATIFNPQRGWTQSATTSQANRSNADELLQRGQQLFQKRDYRGAITSFNQAIIQAPTQAAPYFHRGLVRFQLDDDIGALDDFDDAVQRNPRFANAYLYRGSVLLSLGVQTQGLLDLRLAAQLFSTQGDQAGYEKAASIIKQYNPGVDP